jgi:hypothetical protein
MSKINIPDHIIGLTDTEVLSSRNKSGTNEQVHKETYKWWMALFELSKSHASTANRCGYYIFCTRTK